MGFHQQNGGFNGIYPLVICYIAIENAHLEIVDFPIKNMVIFHNDVSLPEHV